MLKYVKQAEAKEFIIGTEKDMLYALRKENPEKHFYHVSDIAVCPNMKKITLAKVVTALETRREEVLIKESISSKAKAAIEKMVQYV